MYNTTEIYVKEPISSPENLENSNWYKNYQRDNRNPDIIGSSSGFTDYNNKLYFDKNVTRSYQDINNFDEDQKISDLNGSEFILKKPIHVKITKENDELVGEIQRLNLYSYGVYVEMILNELNNDIVELYQYLTANKNKLGILPKRWLVWLNNYIK